MRAIILAGGKGTRLMPHTERVPKPLVVIGQDKTILDVLIQQLVNQGFTHITLAVNHLADMIIEHVGDGSKWNIKIDYSLETEPLHTIGPLTLIQDLPSDFLVINGDVLADVDYAQLLHKHAQRKDAVTITVQKRSMPLEFGVVEYDSEHRLTAFREKPTHEVAVSIGVNCLSRSTIQKIPPRSRYGFDDLMYDSLANNIPVHVFEHNGFWLDIGRPTDYMYAIENFEEIKKFLKL